MKSYLIKKIQLDNTELLKSNSSLERKKAKEVLEIAKKLNRPIKFLAQGFSFNWQKELKKISRKKY